MVLPMDHARVRGYRFTRRFKSDSEVEPPPEADRIDLRLEHIPFSLNR